MLHFVKLEAASQVNKKIRVPTPALRTVFSMCISSCDADDVCSDVSLQLCLQTKSVYLWDVKFLLCGCCKFERPIMQWQLFTHCRLTAARLVFVTASKVVFFKDMTLCRLSVLG